MSIPTYFVFRDKDSWGEDCWYIGVEGHSTTDYRQGGWYTEAEAQADVARRTANATTPRPVRFRSIDIRPTPSISDMDDETAL